MASRRTRIKGITNIPQRKKLVSSTEISTPFNEKLEEEYDINIEGENESTTTVTNTCSSFTKQTILTKKKDQIDVLPNLYVESLDVELKIEDSITKDYNIEFSNLKKADHSNNEVLTDSFVHNNVSQNDGTVPTVANSKQPLELAPKVIEVSSISFEALPIVRRKFLKPEINPNKIKHRTVIKESLEKSSVVEGEATIPYYPKEEIKQSNEEADAKPCDKVVVLSEIRIPSKVACDITKIISDSPHDLTTSCSEVTLNEAYFNANEIFQANRSSIVTFSPVTKFIPETHVSDSEYPAPPPSPSKINRSRIKAIPRLNLRKTSCSASESEDETRKYGRIRNNSVCSVASATCPEPPTSISENAPAKEVLPTAPKKIIRTEQSRKLAEARREFYKRFGTNMPDKQELKMIDLIFYNPGTNPISPKHPPTNTHTHKTEEDLDLKQIDLKEHVANPTQEDEAEQKENDVDNSMPVPQIKIGPSGEIILDEQSLIVENAELAKQKEQIKNSRIVDGDFDTGYGVYKRATRSHAWSQKETLRFYKALNLIGTDFTVMTQLFPKRTRRELKIKFKKEERINRHLIDKAIMQPCRYNFMDLKRELQIEEEEEAFLQKLKDEELQQLKQKKEIKRERKRKTKLTILEERLTKEDPDELVDDLPVKKRLMDTTQSTTLKVEKQPKQLKPKIKKTLNINSVIESEDDADVSDITQSDSDEEEFIPFLKPTRSGRMPKSTIKFTEPDEPPKRRILTNSKLKAEKSNQGTARNSQYISHESSPSRLPVGAFRNRRISSTSSVESNSDKLVPGSVVITTDEGSNGQTEYKVFMVTPERKLTPLQLDSDVVSKLIKEKSSTEFPAVPATPENNVTIPAVEELCVVVKDDENLFL